jgi:hypothetical protein
MKPIHPQREQVRQLSGICLCVHLQCRLLCKDLLLGYRHSAGSHQLHLRWNKVLSLTLLRAYFDSS